MNDTAVGRRSIQMIFQSLALWPHLKVMDERDYSNLSFPLKACRWPRAQIVKRVRNVRNLADLKKDLYDRQAQRASWR